MDILTKLREKIIEYGAFDVGFFNDSFKGFENGISFYVKMSSAILEESSSVNSPIILSNSWVIFSNSSSEILLGKIILFIRLTLLLIISH